MSDYINDINHEYTVEKVCSGNIEVDPIQNTYFFCSKYADFSTKDYDTNNNSDKEQ